MTLGFRTKWQIENMPIHMADKPTYFVDKIWQSIHSNFRTDSESKYSVPRYPKEYYLSIEKGLITMYKRDPKKHTIREDKKNLWKAGNNIHFVIGNRTKNRFQFAPVIPCKSTQRIQIFWSNTSFCDVFVDSKKLGRFDPVGLEHYQYEKLKELAINDGFDSVEDFFSWFNKDFTGKIIHWTYLKY